MRIQPPWKRQPAQTTRSQRRQADAIASRDIAEVIESFQNAWIDVPDDLRLGRNERGTWSFLYYAGHPPAYAFGIEWYRSEEDRALSENLLTTDLPKLFFYPASPNPDPPRDGFDNREGFIEIRAPWVEVETVFFGRATIFQR